MYGCYVVWAEGCDHPDAGYGILGGIKELMTCNPWVAFVGANAAFHFSWVFCLTVCQVRHSYSILKRPNVIRV